MNLIQVVIFYISSALGVNGIRLPNCTSQGWMEIDESSTNVPITCDQFLSGETVTWAVKRDSSGFVELGTCSPTQCSPSVNPLTRPTATTSVMTIASPSRTVHGSWDVRCSVGQNQPSCQLNIVSPPTLTQSNCSVSADTTGDTWNVIGSCYVSKAYSSRGVYSCQWRQTSSAGGSAVSPAGQTDDRPSTASDYYSYTCSFRTPLPTQTARFTYTLTVLPGQVTVTAGSYTIQLPSSPKPGCREGYYREGETLSCTCTLDTAGSPPASVAWLNTNTPGPTIRMTVTSQDNNRQLTCQARWGTGTAQQTQYTVRVAYGPKTVRVKAPTTFDLHPVSPGLLNLTCEAMNFNPGVTFTWSGAQCRDVTKDTCSFRPTISDDDDTITCTATNNVTSTASNSTAHTLHIHYPPTGPPVISGYNGQPLYAGESTDITCTVAGGNPPVSGVTFTCTGQGREVSGTSSNMTLTASRGNHGNTCTCRARWKNYTPGWYTLTADVTINVYYPPDQPTISIKNQRQPFVAGESATLYCGFNPGNERGNPPATLTWRGHTRSPSQGEISLPLGRLTAADNGKTFVCEARNAFTDRGSTPVTQTFTAEVYYVSEVKLTRLPGDTCVMQSPNTCVVKEEQRVHLNCSADSNPALATVAWQTGNSHVLDLTADRDTKITHVCNVTTETKGDNRLPLVGSVRLTILVTYEAELSELTINREPHNVTVNETQPVNITCTARGRPTPAMTVARDGTQLQHTPQGQVTPQDTVTLTHVTSQARCQDTGRYTCQLPSDHSSQIPSTELSLFVNCAPRKPSQQLPDTINYEGRPSQLSVILIAFPVPDNVSFVFHGPANNLTKTETRGKLDSRCETTSPEYNVTCIITIDNITDRDAGLYSARIDNGFGEEIINFTVSYNESKAQPRNPDDEGVNTILIGVVIAAVVGGALVLIGVAILIKRKRRKPQGSQEHILRSLENRGELHDKSDSDDEVVIVNDIYEGTANHGETNQQRRGAVHNDYEDVGVPSSKPKILPKPKPGENSMQIVGDTTYPVVNKSDQPQTYSNANQDNNLYASVAKNKTAPGSQRLITGGTDSRSFQQKPSQSTKEKHPKPKKDKQRRKKGKEMVEENRGAAVYGNTPLSMKPADDTVYENYAFQKDEMERSTDQTPDEMLSNTDNCTKNSDGLVYTTVAFTEEQQRKAQHPPPGRDTTEYVDIDFTRRVPSALND